MVFMVKEEIASLIQDAIGAAISDNSLPELVVPEIVVEHSKPEFGDYACSVALRMSRAARQSPLKLAEVIKAHIPPHSFIAAVEVAAPGFVNFRLSLDWLAKQVADIIAAGEDFGNASWGQGQRVQVEFVSSNPTGPVTIAAARGAAIGDTLANLLQAVGYKVEREFYVNDAGSRMDVFYKNLWYFYQKALGRNSTPPDPIYGAAEPVAQQLATSRPEILDLPESEAIAVLGPLGLETVLAGIKQDLAELGVQYDSWFREQSLFESGAITRTLELLRQNGHVAEKEGATWFVSTALGQEKDNVLVRSDAKKSPTYFVSDIAYHDNKFRERGFDRVINVWGADHQGHIPRLKAALNAIGLNSDDLTIVVMQTVAMRRRKPARRVGGRSAYDVNKVSLREVLDEVGADSIRYNMVGYAPESPIEFDLDVAVEQSNENPVYYVQYAHARACSTLRLATEKKIDFAQADLSLLIGTDEQILIRQMALLPEVVDDAARTLEPQRLPYYAHELAACFHSFYNNNRVIDESNLPLSQARLKLVQAVKITLARTLHLMGMQAPETL